MNVTTNKGIRILIVDDHEIFRVGIQEVLSRYSDVEVVGTATDSRDAVQQTLRYVPEIVLIHMTNPGVDGIQLTADIRKHAVSSKIILLTGIATGKSVSAAIKAGVQGYILDDTSWDEVLNAIRTVHGGEVYFSSSIAMKALTELVTNKESDVAEAHPLTPREVEILRLVAEGRGNKGIAKELIVSEATVSTHMNNILSKLHLSNRVQATLYALRNGLATLS